ncbi:uncharacterized protein LOC122088601 [Macadamia integrifolia]|uniref:uncharacterized protein LOC122088601 n=1 Tax=Macadamia integrifolia TaxID=60698 RepID=UPI001C4F891B|nr:uncharacterized protein LOC122088601 [Macadamia integrifolia]
MVDSLLDCTFAIFCRWFSLLIHTDPTSDDNVLWAHKKEYSPERELEHLKLKTSSLRFLNKSLSNGFLIAKDFIMDALIRTQIVLYTCSSLFIAIPIYTVKKLLECLLPFEHVFPENTEEIENMLQQLSTSGSKITMQDIILEFALSSLGGTFDSWITKKAIADMMRWSNKCKSDCPTNLIQLISKSECKRGENGDFKTKLEEKGTQFFTRFDNEGNFVYRVSCVSVLVLSSFLEEFMATSRWESLRQSLNESFEILEYVDKSNTPNMGDETRWTSTKELWAHWENSKHWFRTKIISQAFKKKSEKSESGDVLKEACCTIEKDFEVDGNVLIDTKGAGGPLASKHENLIKAEFVIISKFLGAEEYGNLYDFLEKCFVQMLCYFLSNLPLAILKEIDGDDPTEIGEGRVRKALKFLVELELLSDKLGDKIEWSWSDKSDPANQGNDENLITRLVARQCGSEVNKAEISIVVDRKVDNIDASLAATSAGRDDDGDTIREI